MKLPKQLSVICLTGLFFGCSDSSDSAKETYYAIVQDVEIVRSTDGVAVPVDNVPANSNMIIVEQ